MGTRRNEPGAEPRSSRPLAVRAFGAMVAEATRHPDVALGLAAAYRSFDATRRRQLVAFVGSDAASHGVDPCSALAVLLGVEGDPGIARFIAETMVQRRQSAAACLEPVAAWMGGDWIEGAAAIARPSPVRAGDVLWVRWCERDLTAGHVPLRAWNEREAVVQALDLRPRVRLRPTELTLDTLAVVLWRRRRQGVPWPPALTELADLFGRQTVGRQGLDPPSGRA